MQVLVDTSVWSLALRRRKFRETPETIALRELIIDGRAEIVGAVRQEILSGLRFPEQFDRLRTVLEPFPDLPVDSKDYIEAASVSNDCVRAGIIAGNTDCLICSVALERNMEILTTDKDFSHIATVRPIRFHELRPSIPPE